MTAHNVCIFLAVLAAATPLGCRRPVASAGSAATPSATATPAPIVSTVDVPPEPDRDDYRTLSKAALEDLIRTKTGVDGVTLIPGARNHYTGTIMAPGGMPLPLEVTVEADRIICDTKTPAGSTRQTITPRGVKSDYIGG